jgi:hypothetical protein
VSFENSGPSLLTVRSMGGIGLDAATYN